MYYPPPDSYLDRDNNIPPEDGDQPPPPLPAKVDPIWCDHGAFWPYVPDAPDGSGGFDSQPPSQPPSPGLSYQTPRTPSLRHRSVTPSHHSSGSGRSRSAHSHPSSGNIRSRSRTLTEEIGTFPHERELFPPTPARPVTPRTYDIEFDAVRDCARQLARRQALETPSAPRFGAIPAQADSYPQEWWEGARSGKYSTIPLQMEWCQGMLPEPSRMFDAEAENSRATARRQALESPLAPQTSAIPQSEIASYPREWHDGACSGKYSYIPSYQGWHRGEQPELAHFEQPVRPG